MHLRAFLLERMPLMEFLRLNDNETNGDVEEETRSEKPSPQHNSMKELIEHFIESSRSLRSSNRSLVYYFE